MEVLDLKAMAEQAVRIHQQGDLVGAEKLYLQILDADPGLFGPDSAAWQVHAHFVAMMTGGLSSLMLQALQLLWVIDAP